MAEPNKRMGGRAARRALRAAPTPADAKPVQPGMEGGLFKPLTEAQVQRIHRAALDVLEQIGLSEAIPSCVELVTGAGGRMTDTGRLLFPRSLVEDT
ncbi:MAG: trimethylamine methyltransferase family protein, partial [Gammaproteobacteria bacterium]|nr:trimethylamine methyltransferase family protein [Gammaproteobacteria bacterium]